MTFGAGAGSRGVELGRKSRCVAPVDRRVQWGETTSFRNEEATGGDAYGGMMMKSSPAATFVMSQSQFLLEFFVVSLDDLAMLGYFYQLSGWGIGRKGGKPIFGWFTLPAGDSISSHSSACGFFLRSSR
jgi:hypothetical protein